MLASAIKAILGIVIILGGWLLVQAAWRRVFPDTEPGEDALAGRLGCHQCPCQTPCEDSKHQPSESALPQAPHSDR